MPEPAMKALIRDRYGSPDVLQLVAVERPVPHESEVLGIPFTFGPPKPRILGSDVAGRVVAVGSGVQRSCVGDEVYGDLSGLGVRGGGVGTIAIQLATLQDVEVTGIDSAAKLEMMRSLSEAREAIRHFGAGHHKGKVVFTID